VTGLELWALLCLVFWIGLTLDRSRAWPRESVLPEVEEGRGSFDSARVIAIVPARNEEATLDRTLPALLQQEGLDLVVVADDGSEDATGEIVDELSVISDREASVRRIEVPPPPAGWSGKVHAISASTERIWESEKGGEEIGNDWWLFIDADIELGPDRVRALLARAEDQRQGGPFDLVSVMARLHTGSFWEKLLIPPFVYFFQLLYPFARVRDSKSRVAAAAGGCVLMRRSVYEAAGGHAAIRGALIDDVALAKLVKGRGSRIWLGLDENIRSIRAYTGIRELWHMVSRNAFVQLGFRFELLILVILGLVAFFLGPPLLIGVAGTEAAKGTLTKTASLRILIWAGVAWLLQARSLLPSIRHHGVPAGFSLTLPLAGMLYGLMTLSSAWSHLVGRGQKWKGRAYRGPGNPSSE
jgi:hopene-associated glycosyltransferase HpnB